MILLISESVIQSQFKLKAVLFELLIYNSSELTHQITGVMLLDFIGPNAQDNAKDQVLQEFCIGITQNFIYFQISEFFKIYNELLAQDISE